MIGNLKTDSFKDIFLNSQLLRKFRRFSKYQVKCGNCQYGVACRGCPAITYALTGDCFDEFKLCEYNDAIAVHEFEKLPSIDCNEKDELDLIKKAMRNFVLLNPKNVIELYPNLITYMREYSKIKTEKEYDLWTQSLFEKIGIDEAYYLSNMLDDLRSKRKG